MKYWLVPDARNSDAITSEFDQPGVVVKDSNFRTESGSLGLVEADSNQFPLSRLEETISSSNINGISVYRDEQHARKAVERLTGKSTR